MYADVNYYNNEFVGDKLISDESELNKFLTLASQKIDMITRNKIVGRGFSNLTEFQKQKVKDATCFQANYIFENGLEPSNIASFGVLDINVSMNQKSTEASELNISNIAYIFLKQTGLTSDIL